MVLEDIEVSPELLNELNDLNKGASFARVFHVESQVLAEVDLVAETLDHDELRVAVERIRELVVRIAPTIALVFGGQEVVDPSRRRLNAYRSTTIEAEIQPGLLRTLNGPHAVRPGLSRSVCTSSRAGTLKVQHSTSHRRRTSTSQLPRTSCVTVPGSYKVPGLPNG